MSTEVNSTSRMIAAKPRGQLKVPVLLESSIAGSAGWMKLSPGAVPVGPMAGVDVVVEASIRVTVTAIGGALTSQG